MSKQMIKIGNAGGYWGDDPSALERQVRGGQLDYITMDFLAEITMSIMQKQRAKDPSAGYARDFIGMLEPVLGEVMARGTTIITNAGGVNPKACAQAIAALGKKQGLKPRIAIVYGDDIMEELPALRTKKGAELLNMETGDSFDLVADRISAANIYFGAAPVVEALKWKPHIVITGRVTDTGITLAPMIHEFGWQFNDWNRLAAGIVAGHMMECGTQVSGGNFTDWRLVPTFDRMGFPYVEMNADGTFVITKHAGTGGLVSRDTVREQLVYEMGDPHAYITPDVVADFATIQLEEIAANRVRVSGIRGYEPTDSYKVSMAYADGQKITGAILISGPDARAKAETFAKIFWEKCGTGFTETATEYVGWNACHRSLGHADDGNEIILRLGARANDPEALKRFGKWIPSLILGGPPGVCVLGGAPKPQEVVSYWPALLDKRLATPRIALYEENFANDAAVTTTQTGQFRPTPATRDVAKDATQPLSISRPLNGRPLADICLARSGDKGDMCNVGVLARSDAAFEFLDQFLTAERMKNWFQELCQGPVVRYKLDNLRGFNFLLEAALGGGGTQTLRADAQGKTFAQALLRQVVEIPDAVLRSVPTTAGKQS